MEAVRSGNDILLKGISCFDLDKTFNCGQAFRWEEIEKDEYIAVVNSKIVHLKKEGDNVHFFNVNYDEDFLIDYFSFDMDYDHVLEKINTDLHMKNCIDAGYGIRLLRQDLFETILSFIISANNNIKRIRKIIYSLCESYGKPIEYLDKTYYAFPTKEVLKDVSKEDFFALRMGYRDGYIYDAVEKINSGEVDLDLIQKADTQEAKSELMKIKGIGEKVADCILLFSLSRYELCPQDVWIKRIFENRYNVKATTFKKGNNLAFNKWGEYAGIAQQYLFYYEREVENGK